MSDIHTPRIEELLPAYALGALEGEEARAGGHLAGGCEECGRQLPSGRRIGELAAAVPRSSRRRSPGRGCCAWREPRRPRRLRWQRPRRRAGPPPGGWRPRHRPCSPSPSGGSSARCGWSARCSAWERPRAPPAEVEVLSPRWGTMRTEVLQATQDLQCARRAGIQAVTWPAWTDPGRKGAPMWNPSTPTRFSMPSTSPPCRRTRTYQLWSSPTASGPGGVFAVDPRGTAPCGSSKLADVAENPGRAVTVEPPAACRSRPGRWSSRGRRPARWPIPCLRR